MGISKFFKRKKEPEIGAEEIQAEVQKLKDKPILKNPFNEEYLKLLKLDWKNEWEERGNFIIWITALSTGAALFTINVILTHFQNVSIPNSLKLSLVFLMLSIVTSIIFKIPWGVKYAHLKLDLTIMKHLWEGTESKNRILEQIQQGKEDFKKEIAALEQGIRETLGVLKADKKSFFEKMKKHDVLKINCLTWLYRISLTSFLIGLLILVFFIFSFLINPPL